jgi:hypothetical protein
MPTYDFYFQGRNAEDINGYHFFTSGYKRSIAICGLWKLTLQWLKLLMTPKGSDPLRPDSGTDFSNLIGSNITSATDVRDVVMLAITDCTEQMQNIQHITQPPTDETLAAVSLDEFALDGSDGFKATVTIHNASDQELSLNLPGLSTRK